MTTEMLSKTRQDFRCISCDYICRKKSDYDKHCLTKKHKYTTNGDILQQNHRVI